MQGSIRRLIAASRYSWQGLKAAFTHEAAFRQEVAVAVLLLPLAFYLGDNRSEQALLSSAILLVLIVELVNSAVEAVIDRVSHKPHTLAKRAKDMGSAAVLLALVNATMVWAIVLLG